MKGRQRSRGEEKKKEENRGKDRQHVINIDQGIEKEEWTGNEFFYYERMKAGRGNGSKEKN